MKGCFFLHRKFAPIGHTIAYNLRKFGITEFCAYVIQRNAYNFLISQKDVHYTSLLLDENIFPKYKDEKLDPAYLDWFEKEYGIPNGWPYLVIDRIIMHGQFLREYPYDKKTLSHEEMLKCLQVYSKEIITFLNREKPDFLVMIVVGSLGSKLLYHIAKKKGIKMIYLDSTRIGNGETVTHDYRIFSWVEETFEYLRNGGMPSLKMQNAIKFLAEFRRAPDPYHIDLAPRKRSMTKTKQLKFLLPSNFIQTLTWIIKITVDFFSTKRDYTDEIPWWSVWDKIKRKIRMLYGFSDLYEKPSPQDYYAFCPLHVEPETATSLYAPFYTDQLYVVRQVARSLPLGWKLYVKEHPAMIGYRTRQYYQELKKNPNVKIIDPAIQSTDLMSSASLVVTIAGTAGWEGVLLKKPVITFGDIFYNKLSTVLRCHGIEELPYLIQKQLTKFQYNEEELLFFIAAIMENSVEVDMISLWEHEDQGEDIIKNNEGLKRVAELIAKKLKLSTNPQ